ncbi:P-loop containing nucleoside triphosphate hydrolase protein [Xylariaceae sp. FL1651]|nr:P-loop containing nucleoside triphosphate hydrolase protein [Xylariaceae sp. FL1651]
MLTVIFLRYSYLKILLPLIVICLSFLLLAAQTIYRKVKLKRPDGYDQIPETRDHTVIPPQADDLLSSDEDEGLSIHAGGGGRLALVKTTTKGSIVQADNPPAQNLIVVVEETSICGLIAVNTIALISNTYAGRGRTAAVVGLLTWAYVLVLVTLRLFLGNTKWRVPRLWNHTAFIYGFQWLFTLILFRSVMIRASSRLTQILVIVEFSLTTLLFGIALTTRKGNKTVLLEWEDNIEPSREPLASVFSLATFAWVDAILWQGYKEPLEMERVWNLIPRDKAAIILGHYHQVKKTTSLALHLAKYFKGMLIAQCLYAVFSGFVGFVPTLLLRAILQYVETPTIAPRNVLWLYVILLPVTDMLRSISDNQALWIGRKICIRIRAIIIGEIYAKALRRKAASGAHAVLSKTDQESTKETKFQKLKRCLGLKKKDEKGAHKDDAATRDPAKEADEQANIGTIINLMSVDSFKISECTSYLHFLLASAPTMLIVSVALLWQIMGLSAIPGLIIMALLIPVNISLAKGFNYTQKKIMAATDKRIHTTNEILQNIRIIKYFAWEERFGAIVDEKRRAELRALRNRYILWALAVAIWNTVPILITFFSFLVYTKVEGKPLYPSVAFTAISLFLILRIPLDQLGDMLAHVQEAKVSVDRVEEFLMEDETEKYQQLGQDNVDENGRKVIGFRDATFIWGNKDATAADGSVAFRLLDLDIDFKIGKLNIIAGPTGSGKTSMLMALLGEMTLTKGKVYFPGGCSREDVQVDPATKLADTFNANIKENILFASPYDETRYKEVLILDNGDETLVGENGITLSGGQKQRISLARAVYSNSQHLLLDDCLSAVDSHTAKWIFGNCINGPLMKGRTCILVTHNTTLCAPWSEYAVLLDNGRSGKLGDEIRSKSRLDSQQVSRVPSRVPSSVGEDSEDTLAAAKKNTQKQDAMLEGRATGAVKWSVMKLYLGAMGHWWFWAVAAVVFTTQQLKWANQYTSGTEQIPRTQFNIASQYSDATLSLFGATPDYSAMDVPEVNVDYYLFILALIGIAGAALALVRDLWLFFGSLTASAQFKFFDITPLGQLMNRFSKDLEAVDQEVAGVAIGVMTCTMAVTPAFLVAAKFYLRASRDLKRLESVNRSPLFQQFGETLSGRRFIRDNLARINKQAHLVGDFVAFFAGVFVILSLGNIDAGSAGLSLSYAIGFSENILWLIRLYAMNEQNMNSVERVKEYLDNRPPKNWPAHGSVEFVGYSTRYRKDLDPVLKGVTFKIEPRQKVGIVGRTGAGKTEAGKILIDDVDIGLIGTLRTNLDPFELYTDEEIFAALRKVHLIAVDISPSGSAIVTEGDDQVATGASTPTATNKNIFYELSSPRQLLCLARAMLKNPTVLIQDTIRELNTTIITIAHHHGEVKKTGTFRSMCEMSGDLDNKRLVDDV